MALVVKYNSQEHYALLCEWLEDKGIPAPDSEYFSDCGYVVNNNAIGFLFKTNSKTCYIDHVASNPDCSKEDRNESLDVLFKHLEMVALKDGFKCITALASLDSMKNRFIKHNYNAFREFTLFFKVFR